MNKCGASKNFYVCELPVGHLSRHRNGDFTWLDHAVAAARVTAEKICGARCPDENGGPDYICQLPPHRLYPAAKHRDNRNGSFSWTQAGADRVAAELEAKSQQ